MKNNVLAKNINHRSILYSFCDYDFDNLVALGLCKYVLEGKVVRYQHFQTCLL